ncbi:MAG: NAD(P)H-binding protein [Gemmatimonadales bacterium]|jgi:uncharacterized protein YbjT (DUF2867 family)
MRIFVAGGTAAVGKSLVPHLVETGHEVVALIRTPEKGRKVEAHGAEAVVADALNKDQLTAAIRRAGTRGHTPRSHGARRRRR